MISSSLSLGPIYASQKDSLRRDPRALCAGVPGSGRTVWGSVVFGWRAPCPPRVVFVLWGWGGGGGGTHVLYFIRNSRGQKIGMHIKRNKDSLASGNNLSRISPLPPLRLATPEKRRWVAVAGGVTARCLAWRRAPPRGGHIVSGEGGGAAPADRAGPALTQLCAILVFYSSFRVPRAPRETTARNNYSRGARTRSKAGRM